MMKPRISQRVIGGEQAAISPSSRSKVETLNTNGANNQQSSAQARKRRSSINVYDQPSSLNSRLRQLETDMLRLDEDRTKLFDDTHSALAQYELKLSEIHAILKSRQDNVEKYVEDMRMLLLAKEDFEKQTKLLTEKHDRIHEKFMHRETIISREIKLLKNKFEVLEKNRQFKTMLQKSGADSSANDDLNSGLDSSFEEAAHRKRSETGTMLTVSEIDSFGVGAGGGGADGANMDDKLRGLGSSVGAKSVRIKMSNLSGLSQVFSPLLGSLGKRRRGGNGSRSRRKSNKVSSIMTTDAGDSAANELMTAAVNQLQDQSQLASNHSNPAAGAAGESTDSRFVVSSPATKKPSFFGRLFKR